MKTNLAFGQYSAMPALTIAAFAVLSLLVVSFGLIIVSTTKAPTGIIDNY
jgi:hypothetical protein